ncbi:MAG TPA: bifunctional riboflavin kinase/FAD synthetase [Propionibacteriaceae bacterium]|nr:bifunctional riboflavin kinase/FAD synthetase [Propionibacteriaceae bacterium]
MNRSVVVIGNFDGVHRGHIEVLQRARERAAGRPLIVVTFWPHPIHVLRPDVAPKLLTSLDDRIELLKDAGATEVRVVQFNRDVSTWAPDEFVARILLPLNPLLIVVGEDFRFGVRASGTVAHLRELGASQPPGHEFQVESLSLVRLGDAKAGSTLIRAALDAGDVESAARQLGRPFRVRGVVVMGDQRGRELGFPTANLPVPPEMAMPADGVYAGWLRRVDNVHQVLPAAVSVGTNPTFDGVERRVESYVLDRDDLELYGVTIAVDFVARLRGQIRFDGIGPLVAQMHQDVATTRVALGLN